MGYNNNFLLSYLALWALFMTSAAFAAKDDVGGDPDSDSSPSLKGSSSSSLDDDDGGETSALFNITKILNKHPDYSAFNSLLTQHKVAGMINRRKTITVLVVSDVSAITEHKDDAVKRILMNHVILDFYGVPKLNRIKRATLLTTMLQTTGAAYLRQGFINVTKEDGEVVMGSAVPDSDHNSKLLEKVMIQPYDISVLAISQPIIAPGIDDMVERDPDHEDARAPRKSRAPREDISSPPEEEEEVADSPGGKKAKAPSPKSSGGVAVAGLGGAAAVMVGLVWLLAVV